MLRAKNAPQAKTDLFVYRKHNGATFKVIPNNESGDGSQGLSEIIHEMEKKLDSAQRKFNPKFGKLEAAKVKQFDTQFENEEVFPEKNLKRSQTVGSLRQSSRDLKTPSTMERTGPNKASGNHNYADKEDAYTPQQFKATASI